MDVFDLSAKLSLDSSEYERGLDEASGKTSHFGDLLKANLASAAVMKGLELLVSGVSKFANALPSAISSLAEYGDNIDKMSQKMGMSAEAYQEWDAVMQHSGTSMETLKASMKTLANAAETGSDAFEQLGISQEQIASMSQEDLFNATITALQGVTDETQRTYLAGKLLGRGATELGPLLNTTAEETQAMKDRVHELNGVMSDESVKAAARFQDSLQDMQTAIGGAKRSLVEGFLPSVADIMDGLTNVISGADVEGGMAQIDAGIDAFVNQLDTLVPRIVEILDRILPVISDALPRILEKVLPIVIEFLTQLAVAIVKALPSIIKALVEAMPDVIKALGNALIEAAPILLEAAAELIGYLLMGIMEGVAMLAKAGAELMGALIQGIGDKIRDAMDKVHEVVTAIGDTIKEFFTSARDWGVNLMTNFVGGIHDMISAIGQKIAEIGSTIWNGIKDLIDRAKSWGRDLIANFISGITGKLRDLWDTIKGVGQGIKNFLGFSEPKLGPLSNFHTYAPDMMKLFAQGIRENEHLVTDQIARSFDFDVPSITRPATAQVAAEGSAEGREDMIFALLSEYLPVIAAKRLTVDSGSLARSLAPAIDEQLGTIQSRKGRESYAAAWG